MGRPTLYHTVQDKQQANRAKSKRYYDRAREEVCARRSVKYREIQRNTREFPSVPGAHKLAPKCVNGDKSPRTPNHVDYWSECAEAAAAKFHKILGRSPFHFVDTIYNGYLLNQNLDTFRDAIITITQLQKSIRQCQGEILQLAGVGKQFERCKIIAKSVDDVLKALEDALCYGMTGIDDLVQSHSRQELLYLTLPIAEFV
ncbi:hypothetical protein BDZ94DRAFT_1259612 [Collybia nuda]|uniref:Uncharacterized protein n=1 Tax=Collybia nuda TaxID=64659 RepID=A0A9P6CEQ2_9AGAR|nr:hypothetical protein BDZ94DRAFT_1259612 [Collybia nuda]